MTSNILNTTLAAAVVLGAAAIGAAPAWPSLIDDQSDSNKRLTPTHEEMVLARGGFGGRGGGFGGGFGGGARDFRGGSMSSINHGSDFNRNWNTNTNVNRNWNNNVNVNRNVNVNGNWGRDWDDGWHPAATAAAVAATAAVVGSVVNSVPADCGAVYVNDINYYQCGSGWYQPQYYGTSVQYVVVNPPQ